MTRPRAADDFRDDPRPNSKNCAGSGPRHLRHRMHGRLGLITLRAPDRTTPSSGVSWRKFVRKSSVETPGAAVGKRRSAACEGSTPHVLPPLNRVENAIASGRDVEPDIDQNLRAVFRIFEHGRLEAMLVEPNAHRGHSFGKIDRVHPYRNDTHCTPLFAPHRGQ